MTFPPAHQQADTATFGPANKKSKAQFNSSRHCLHDLPTMSHETSDDDERQYDPSGQIFHEADAFGISGQPSFNLEVTPPAPSHGVLAPTQTDPHAAQFVQYSPGMLYPAQNQSGHVPPGQWHNSVQNPHGQLYPVQNQPEQSPPGPCYYPAQSQPGQSVPGQNQPLQNQPLQGQPIQNHPSQVQPMQIQAPLPVTFHPAYSTWSPGDLVGYLGAAHILVEDLQHLGLTVRPRLSKSDWDPVDQLVQSGQLMYLLHSPALTQLLVHAHRQGGARISGLSVFCESLRSVFTMYPGHVVPLLFFCGRHATVADGQDPNKPPSDPSVGARGLMRSFVSQLLENYYIPYGIGIPMIPGELDAILNGDLDALSGLFSRLVHMLPPGCTVFCLVDGVEYFEREELLDDTKRVMEPLLQLARSGATPGPLKVLLTSPTSTSDVRDWVHDGAILSLAQNGRQGVHSVTSYAGLRGRLEAAVRGENQDPDS